MDDSNKEKQEASEPSPFCVNIFPADSTGCDFYRNFAPRETVEHCIGDVTFNTCRKFTIDMNFFKGVNVNVLQRQVSDAQCEYYLKFIIPMSRKCGSWIVYNIDDCIHKDDIPKYNKAWDVYQSDKYMDNIKKMVQSSDFVLVTTEELGKYYVDRFGASEDSIICIPNYVPFWWMGHFYDIARISYNYDVHVNKNHRPRIALIGAPAHYDVNKKGLDNDITPILDYVKKTIKDYQWVVFGSTIPELQEYIDRKEIEFYSGIDILHYPYTLHCLNLQYIVAPLADNVFNRCKSNIKLTESWALGVGCAGQNICTYNKYTNDVFDDGESLDAILKKDLASVEDFTRKIDENHKRMKDWWLEGHLNEWLDLYHLRQKPLVFNYDGIEKAESGVKTPTDDVIAPKITRK
jgi:O-antigen biosynthesis protein